jgi:DNA-binding PadR family transcriptional regulator
VPQRKITNLLALAVLATVIERPMHPYEMASLMRARGKEQDMEIKWGSLYRVVDNLVKHGFLVVAQSERQGGRPERTVYQITDAGRAELVDWTRELIAVPDRKPGPFTAGLSVLAVLGPDDVARLLARRADALDAEINATDADLAGWAQAVPRLFLLEVEYALAMRRAELAWVRALHDEITEGTLPLLAEWRTFHETGEMPADIAALAARGTEEEQ